MASVAFDLFLPEVYLEAPGVPDPVAVNAIRNACFDFCRESLLWNEVQDAEAYTANEPEYQLSAPSGAQVVSVMNVNIDEHYVVYPAQLDSLVAAKPAWASATGKIEAFVQPAPDTIRFVSVPDAAGTFTATVAYAPTRTATTIDARIYNQHLETIKYGALWKLKQMLGQPWSDPAGAQYYEGHFWMGVNAATVERQRSNSRAVLRITPRAFV